MSRRLYLLRHAKSSWDFPGLTDFERPLNKRGERDAPRLAQWLGTQEFKPQRIISSEAERARRTALEMSRALQVPLELNAGIYGAGLYQLMDMIRNWDDHCAALMLVGHNPQMTSLVNRLGDAELDNLPTCGLVCIRFDVDSWAGIDRGQTEWMMWPKKLPDR